MSSPTATHPQMSPTPWDLSTRVIAVVGCGPGIGLGSARVLASAGATIACVDIDAAVADASVAAISRTGTTASPHVANVLERAQVRAALREVSAQHGRLDGVLNVVGHTHVEPAQALADTDWLTQMDVNLRHHFIVAQESIAHLEPTSGSYAAVGSINGLNSSPTSVAYGVAKAGLVSMVRTFAWELAPRGIRFNVIAPGIVRTARAIAMGRDSAAYLSMVPLGRLAEPEDVGASALYLLSELGRHVTGQVLVVDGGSTVNHCLGNGRSD